MRSGEKKNRRILVQLHVTQAPIKYLNTVLHKRYYNVFPNTLVQLCCFFERNRLIIAIQAPADCLNFFNLLWFCRLEYYWSITGSWREHDTIAR